MVTSHSQEAQIIVVPEPFDYLNPSKQWAWIALMNGCVVANPAMLVHDGGFSIDEPLYFFKFKGAKRLKILVHFSVRFATQHSRLVDLLKGMGTNWTVEDDVGKFKAASRTKVGFVVQKDVVDGEPYFKVKQCLTGSDAMKRLCAVDVQWKLMRGMSQM